MRALLPLILAGLLLAGCDLFFEMKPQGGMVMPGDTGEGREGAIHAPPVSASAQASSSAPDTERLPLATPSDVASSSASGPSYASYANHVLADGRTKVLFFHAPWCPFCVKSDANLHALYGTQAPTISTYKVDFDSATELRQRYGVVVQDTFVVIDGDGGKIDVRHNPTMEDLSRLLTPS